MKKTIFFLLLLFVSCTGPYGAETSLKTLNDLPYPYQVSRQELSNEQCIAFYEQGKGNRETILFIHGLGSYMRAWERNVPELSKKYRCITLDLPGYGKSCKGKYEGSMAFFAGVLIEFLDSLSIEECYFAGHSMGGQISMVTSLLYPQRVKGLILVAPAGFEYFDEGEKQWFREIVTARSTKLATPQQIQVNITSNFYKYPKEADFMIKDRIAMRTASDFDWYCYIIPQCISGMVDQPVIDKLEKISKPTLIFFGENDNLIPNRFLNGGRTEDIARFGASKIKGSILKVVPKCGHFAQYEAYQEFNTAVGAFIP
jgi:pimeloyl-ACP methyl ester carboxylesterase